TMTVCLHGWGTAVRQRDRPELDMVVLVAGEDSHAVSDRCFDLCSEPVFLVAALPEDELGHEFERRAVFPRELRAVSANILVPGSDLKRLVIERQRATI